MNGFFSYIILSDFIKSIGEIYYGFLSINKKCPLYLSMISAGNFIHHIETKPGEGAKLMRAAGSAGFIISQDLVYSFLKMGSGWLLKIYNLNIAIVGRVSNENHFVTKLKKAGDNRNLGFRPNVRGVAKNPCDHPHGGGEGTGSPPRAHRTPYGKLTKSPTTNKKIQKKNRFLFRIFKKK